jgi:hypothetical protein
VVPPKATIIGLLLDEGQGPRGVRATRDGAKADLVAASLGEAIKLCIEATGIDSHRQPAKQDERSATTVV